MEAVLVQRIYLILLLEVMLVFLEIQRKQDWTAHIHLIHCRRRLLLVV